MSDGISEAWGGTYFKDRSKLDEEKLLFPKNMKRAEVYQVVDGERDYQDKKWGSTASSNQPGNGERTIDEFAAYIQGYTNDLIYVTSHFGDPAQKLDVMRKIAGLCVACAEQHGLPERGTVLPT